MSQRDGHIGASACRDCSLREEGRGRRHAIDTGPAQGSRDGNLVRECNLQLVVAFKSEDRSWRSGGECPDRGGGEIRHEIRGSSIKAQRKRRTRLRGGWKPQASCDRKSAQSRQEISF